jgi:hypothetical protein
MNTARHWTFSGLGQPSWAQGKEGRKEKAAFREKAKEEKLPIMR